MRPLVIAIPIWLTFAVVSALYLYYAGRLTARMREHHGRAWEHLQWLPEIGSAGRRKYYPPNSERAFFAIVFHRRPRFNDAELDRLANITRVLAVLVVLCLAASIAVFALFRA